MADDDAFEQFSHGMAEMRDISKSMREMKDSIIRQEAALDAHSRQSNSRMQSHDKKIDALNRSVAKITGDHDARIEMMEHNQERNDKDIREVRDAIKAVELNQAVIERDETVRNRKSSPEVTASGGGMVVQIFNSNGFKYAVGWALVITLVAFGWTSTDVRRIFIP